MRPRQWLTDRDGVDWPRVAAFALGIAVVITVGFAGMHSSAAFSPYTPSWEGTESLSRELDTAGNQLTVADRVSRYERVPANRTVSFVIAPRHPYSSAELTTLRQFVEEGGRLVVLASSSEGNQLMAGLGASGRFDGRVLRDERFHHRGPLFPVATSVRNHPFTAGVEQLTLNYGTAVRPASSTVLVATSDYAYLVADPNSSLDESDVTLGTRPVVTSEAIENGTVVAVGDPSITIDAMIDEPDNRAFLHNLGADKDRVIIDVSHGGSIPPFVRVRETLRGSPLLQSFGGLVGLALVLVAATPELTARILGIRARFGLGRPRSGERDYPDDPPAVRELLAEMHPEWSGERIDRIITALKRDRPNEQDDR